MPIRYSIELRGPPLLTLEELLASKVALPSIPKVIALLLSELDRDEPDLKKISQLINTDPVLTTRLLKLANSAQFQLANKIGSVSEALALMGLNQVRSLTTAAAVASAFKAVPGMDMHQFWGYSLNVGKLSRMLSGMIRQNQGAAFTAGLIHCIGELVLHQGMPTEMATLNQQISPFDPKRVAAERRLLGGLALQGNGSFPSRLWMRWKTSVGRLKTTCTNRWLGFCIWPSGVAAPRRQVTTMRI